MKSTLGSQKHNNFSMSALSCDVEDIIVYPFGHTNSLVGWPQLQDLFIMASAFIINNISHTSSLGILRANDTPCIRKDKLIEYWAIFIPASRHPLITYRSVSYFIYTFE